MSIHRKIPKLISDIDNKDKAQDLSGVFELTQT